jgi:hypothetical protein
LRNIEKAEKQKERKKERKEKIIIGEKERKIMERIRNNLRVRKKE